MAGPTAAILLRSPLEPTDEELLLEFARGLDSGAVWRGGAIAFQIERGAAFEVDVPVGGCPFSISVEEGELGSDPDAIRAAVGFTAVQRLAVVAHSNSSVDHVLLGRIVVELAPRFGGLVDLGGPIPGGVPDGYEGRLVHTVYAVAVGTLASSDIVDVDFLRWWLRQPTFRMVK